MCCAATGGVLVITCLSKQQDIFLLLPHCALLLGAAFAFEPTDPYNKSKEVLNADQIEKRNEPSEGNRRSGQLSQTAVVTQHQPAHQQSHTQQAAPQTDHHHRHTNSQLRREVRLFENAFQNWLCPNATTRRSGRACSHLLNSAMRCLMWSLGSGRPSRLRLYPVMVGRDAVVRSRCGGALWGSW